MVRRPAVAGMFYPAESEELALTIDGLWPSQKITPQEALAIVSPHAGYVYSGRIAAQTVARVVVPDTAVVLGPNHQGLGAPAAIMTEGSWLMPGGQVELDTELGRAILAKSRILEDDWQAHSQEHSLEVQLPFLRRANPNLKLVPICMARFDLDVCQDVGRALAEAIKEAGRPVLIVASTDMTHYESQASAEQKDRQAIEMMLDLDPTGLYQVVASQGITMCGVVPTATALFAAKALGASRAELVRYTTSGEVSGDYGQVVGYVGLIIS